MYSIILATKNRCHLLKRAINSVLKQTYRDFELIIINDGSTDGTKQYLYTLNDERILHINVEMSLGVAGARNEGIKVSKGEYILFLDDDDEYLPWKLQTINQYINEHTVDSNTIIYTDMVRINKGGELQYWISPEPTGKDIINEEVNDFQGVSLAMAQIVVHRDLLFRVGLLNGNNPNMEDVDFYLTIHKYVHYERIAIPTLLYYDTNGISFNPIKTIESRLILIEAYFDRFIKSPRYLTGQLQYFKYQLALIGCNVEGFDLKRNCSMLLNKKIKNLIVLLNKYPDLLEFYTLVNDIEMSDEKEMLSKWSDNLKRIKELLCGIKENYQDRMKSTSEICCDVYSELFSWQSSNRTDMYGFVSTKGDTNRIPFFLYDWRILDGYYSCSSIYSRLKDGKLLFTCEDETEYSFGFTTMKLCKSEKKVGICLDNSLVEKITVSDEQQDNVVTFRLGKGFHCILFSEDGYENNEILYRSFRLTKQ